MGTNVHIDDLCREGKEQDIEQYRYRHDAALPNAVDWRKAGIVGPIKNQHAGGSPVRHLHMGL